MVLRKPSGSHAAKACLCVALGLLLPRAASANQYRFDVWTVDNGLPQNIIRGICQTSDGYLWLATLDGIARFDGVRFVVFNRSNTQGLLSNRFTSLYKDSMGDLWFGTESTGVTRYSNGTFTSYTNLHGLPHNSVRAVTGDRAGHIFVLGLDSIAEWDRTRGTFLNVTPNGLSAGYDTFLWEGGGFWGWTPRVLRCLVEGEFKDYPLPAWLSGNSIRHIARDQSGTIWIETVDGKQARLSNGRFEPVPLRSRDRLPVITYRNDHGKAWDVRVGRRLIRFMSASGETGEQELGFNLLFFDDENNLWLGTEGQGLYRLREQVITTYSTPQGLIDRDIYPITQDRSGAIWIGAWHTGLSRFEGGRFMGYTVKDGLSSALLTSLYPDEHDILWVAAHGGLRVFRNGRFIDPHVPGIPDRAIVQSIFQDRHGTFWFGTSQGLVRFDGRSSALYQQKNGLAGEDVHVILGSASGDLWIGSYGGLTRVRQNQFTRWTEENGLPGNMIRSLYEDAEGVLWIGTYDAGLGRLEHDKITRYSTRQGLFDDGAFQILEDRRGYLWISCNRGIYRVKKDELNELAAGNVGEVTSVAYGKIDGMLNRECNGGLSPAGIRSRDGRLWFPTEDGVAVIDSDAVWSNPKPPRTVIESLVADRTPIPHQQRVSVPPGKHNLEIQYTALSFVNSDQIRFRYKLEGLDTDWVDAGLRRTAYYSHLHSGFYTFKVIARNSDGVWDRVGKSMSITVLAPFYETRWFQLFLMMLAAALIWAAWRFRVTQFERAQARQRAFSRQLIASQEQERKRIAAELHDTIGQRLVVIKNLVSLFRKTCGAENNGNAWALDEVVGETALAIDETREISYNLRPFHLDRLGLTKAVQYLARTIATASGLKIDADLDNIDDVFPEDLRINFYRIVQECLNNIMKHAQATEVNLSVKRTGALVRLMIEDNGRGFKQDVHSAAVGTSGFGISGMAERARLLGGEMRINAVPGKGTMTSVEFSEQGAGRA